MTIIEKIKQSVEGATGMPFLYHAAGELNELIARCKELPVAYSFLIDSGTIDDVNGRYHERVTLAVMFCDKTEFDFNALENEQIIDRMKVKAYKWMQSLRMSNVLRVVSVNNTQRLYDNTTDILTGFAVNITIEDIAGVGECELPQVVIDVDKNGSYDVVGVDKVRVNVQPKVTDLVATENDKEYLPADYGVYAFSKVKTDIKEAEEKEVNFYDYKGKRVFSYSASEAMALTELPVCPSDEFAEFLKWSEDLETVKMGLPLDVGAYYTCPDGWCGIAKIDTNLKERGSREIYVMVGQRYKYNLKYIIDWGDGNTEEVTTTQQDDYGVNRLYHIYNKAGEYVIKYKNADGNSSKGTMDFLYRSNTEDKNNLILKQIHWADGVLGTLRGNSYSNLEYYTYNGKAEDNMIYQTGDIYSVKCLLWCEFWKYGQAFYNATSCEKAIIPSWALDNFGGAYPNFSWMGNNGRISNTHYIAPYKHKTFSTYGICTTYGSRITLPTATEKIGTNYGSQFNNNIVQLYTPIPPVATHAIYNTAEIHIPIGSLNDYVNATNWGSAIFIEDIPTTINSFSITADDVAADATTTTIHVKANLSMGAMYDDTMVPRDLERDVTSDAFEANTTGQPRQVTISFTMLGETRTCTITQGA